MKQNNSGRSFGSPAVRESGCFVSTTERRSTGLLSRSRALLAFAFLLTLQLFSAKVNAQSPIPTISLTNTVSPLNATSGCVGSGFYVTGMTSADHWDYTVSTCGYTGITMSFHTSSSNTGPHTAIILYSIDGGGSYTNSGLVPTSYTLSGTTCKAVSISLPAACENNPNLKVRILMSGGASGGTNRMPSDGGFRGTMGLPCNSAPVNSGTIASSVSTVCAGTGATYTLTPPCGNGYTYQWYTSTGSIIPGETGLTYSPTLSTPGSITYSVVVTCPMHGSAAPSTSPAVTVNALPSAGTITQTTGTTPLVTTQMATLTNTGSTPGSITTWSTADASIASIDPSTAIVTGNFGGSTVATYSVLDPVTFCASSTTFPINVVFPNTLALYAGHDGNSTDVITIPGASVTTPVTATGSFGSATPCGSGGISGLTVNPSVVSFDPVAGPYISYIINPTSTGNVFRINEFHVAVRRSGTGPDQARLAYRIAGGSGPWTMDEGIDHTITSTSCGSTTNSWYWTPASSITTPPGTSFEIAVFPYHSASVTGTFQVNDLEVIGSVTSSVTCTSAPLAGVITPSVTTACVSGFEAASFTGDPSVGVSYHWEVNANGTGFMPISGASNVFYTSPVFTTVPTNNIYRVISTCASVPGTPSTSSIATFDLGGAPTAFTVPAYITIGTPVTLTSPTPTGGTWSSNYINCASIGSSSGTVTGHISGVAEIRYSTGGFGQCSVTNTVSVVYPCTDIAYLGRGGNSTAVDNITGTASISATGPLTVTNGIAPAVFTTGTSCSFGGLSGLILDASVTSFNSLTNPYVSFTTTTTDAFGYTVQDFIATLRSSGNGPDMFRLAYRVNGGLWNDNGSDLPIDIAGAACGKSNVAQFFGSSIATDFNDQVDWAIFPFYTSPVFPLGTFQVNSIDLGCSGCAVPVTPIQDATNNFDLAGHTYGTGCSITLSVTPAGGAYTTSDPHAVVTGSVLSFTAGMPDGPVDVTYTNSCGNLSTVSTITFDHTATHCNGANKTAPQTNAVVSVNADADVKVYPNPTSNVLNIVAAEPVNVAILSMDGKTVISQNNATSINVSKLASGLYMIKVYNQKDALIKTAKFTKE